MPQTTTSKRFYGISAKNNPYLELTIEELHQLYFQKHSLLNVIGHQRIGMFFPIKIFPSFVCHYVKKAEVE
ncbi:hypothetical protein ADU37_CDS05600 [Thermococcus sp. 2319x1]|nr:hypothetical protein ADU37_CDS05600 [Thermococcus sp. 2319x1]